MQNTTGAQISAARAALLLRRRRLSVDRVKLVLAVRVAHADAHACSEPDHRGARDRRACGEACTPAGEAAARGGSRAAAAAAAAARGAGGGARNKTTLRTTPPSAPYASLRIVFSMHVSHVSDTCRSERANMAREAAAARRGAAPRARAAERLARWPARMRRRTRSSGFEVVDAAIAPRWRGADDRGRRDELVARAAPHDFARGLQRIL